MKIYSGAFFNFFKRVFHLNGSKIIVCLCLGTNLIKSMFRDTQIFSTIFQGYFEAREAQRQQGQVHPDFVTLMSSLKALGTSESLNETIAYVLVFHLNCSLSRNWHDVFDSSRSLSVDQAEWSLGGIATYKHKDNGEQDIRARIILYTGLCGTRPRMSLLEHQST